MAILTKPSRSYTASVMSSEDSHAPGRSRSRPGAAAGKDGIRVYRPPRSEHFAHSHLTHDAHPSSSFAPLPLALQSRKLRKQDREENRQAELNQILAPDYSSSGRNSGLSHRDSRSSYTAYPGGGSTLGSSSAGPSRLGMGRPGAMARPGGLSNTQRTAANGKQTVGVYVDSEGKLHDTEFDPFAGVSQMTRRKSRRRSAFGADRRAGSSTSSSSVSDEEPSGGSDRQREMSRRLESERRRMVGDSDHMSILSHRPSTTGQGAGMAVAARRKSLRDETGKSWTATTTGSSDDGHSVFVAQQAHGHGRHIPSPLSPTEPNTAATGSSFATATSHLTTNRGDTPATSTDGDSQPRSEAKRRPEPLLSPLGAKLAPRSPSLYTSNGSTSVRTSGEKSRYPHREHPYPETAAQQAAREAMRVRSSADLPQRTPAATAPSIEIVEDDVVPAIKLQPPPKIRGYPATASPGKSSHHPGRYALSTHTEDPKPPSTIFDTTNMGYLPSRWASGDREWREGEQAKEKYRPREWGGRHGNLGGREEEWSPSCMETVKRNWRDLTLATRFGLFRTKKKILRKADL